MTDYFLVLVNTIGTMAICVLLYGVMQRRVRSAFWRRLGVGFTFGCGGIVMMAQPIMLGSGFLADARGAFVGMAAAFGGPLGAITAVVLTATARVILGGGGALTGAMVIATTGAGALAWRYQVGDRHRKTWLEWLTISLICVAPSALALLFFVEARWETTIFLSMVVGLVVFSFGKMLETEQRRGRRERTLAKEASTDSLTSIPNRRALENYALELEREKATGVLFLLLDVDNFKKINDQHGHATGDAVLRDIGTVMRTTVRDTDYAARVGGEEFAVIAHCKSGQAGHLVAERFRKALRVPFGTDQHTHVSIGGYFFDKEPFNYTKGYQRADQALYTSKKNGRNCVTFYQLGESFLRAS